MSIQCELGNDPQRGAGYGLLQIRGAGPVQGPVRFSLMRNQGTTPYLGPGGLWQATEFWHPVGETAREGETLTLPLGPDIIDPLVALPSTVAFRLTLAGGETRSAATLRVSRPLLGTGALAPRASPAASPPPEPPEPLPPPAPVSEPPQPLPAPPPETAATPPAPRRRAFWAGAAPGGHRALRLSPVPAPRDPAGGLSGQAGRGRSGRVRHPAVAAPGSGGA